jgi:DNA repair protein RadC
MFTDTGVNMDDVKKAADKLGLSPDDISSVKPEDIKRQNLVGAAAEGFSNVAAKILAFGGRKVGELLGADEDKMDYGAGRMIGTLSNWGGVLGENPRPDKIHWDISGITHALGGATGQLAAYAVGGEVGGIAGIGKSAGTMSTLFASTYDDNVQLAKSMGIDDPAKQNGYAFIRSLTNAFIFTKLMEPGKIFGGAPAVAGGAGAEELLNLVKQKGLDGVTKEALRPVIGTMLKDGLKETGRVLTAAEVDKTADFVTSTVMGGDLKDRSFLKESLQEGAMLALATVIPATINSGRRTAAMGDFYKKSMYDMGSRPADYIGPVYRAYEDGRINYEEAQGHMKTIAAMARAVNATPDYSSWSEKGLTEAERINYNANLVRDNVLRERLDALKQSPDPVQERAIQNELKTLEADRETILRNAGGAGSISVENIGRPQGQPEDKTGTAATEEPAPAPEPEPKKPGPQGEAATEPKPQTATEFSGFDHPVMTAEEFRNLQPGDQVHMETPTGRIVRDTVASVDNGEVGLKNTGVFRNESVVDPTNVGMRFVKPQEQKKTEPSGSAIPKTPANENGGEGTNIQQQSTQTAPQQYSAVTEKPKVGDVLFDSKKGEEVSVTKVSTPAKGSALEKEPYLVDLTYSDGRKAINMPIGDRFKSKTQGGQDAIREPSPMEGMLRKEGEGVELQEVGKGDAGGVQQPAQRPETQTQQSQAQAPLDRFGGTPAPDADRNLPEEQAKAIRLSADEIQFGRRKNNVIPIASVRASQGPSGKWYYGLDVNIGNGGFGTAAHAGRGRSYPTKDAAIAAGAEQALKKIGDYESGATKTEKPLIAKAKEDLQNLINQHETRGQQTTGSGNNAENTTASDRRGQGNASTVRDEAAEVRGTTEGGSSQGNGEQAGSAEGQQQSTSSKANRKSGAKTKEAEIRSRLEEKKKAFRDALRKSRGTLSLNAMDPDVIARGIEMLATYAELGYHKFSEIARDLVKTFGKEFTREDVDGLRGVYAYERSLRKPAERAKMESDEAIDRFYEQHLENIYNPAEKIPQSIRLGREGAEYKLIGQNSDGLPIYEDANGVRTIPAEKGSSIYANEPVNITPAHSGIEAWIGNRPNEYKTVEELAARPLESALIERQGDNERRYLDDVKNNIDSNNKLTIVDLRRLANKHGLEAKDTYLQDLAETAVVEIAREIKQQGLSDSQTFGQMIELYNRQPSFNMRSSERVEKQQYSTPAPISFAAGMYIGHKNPDLVQEPSAGNGLMTIYFPPSKVHVNEIDPVRLANLQRQGYAVVTSQDATKPFDTHVKYGGLVTNPPFGSAPEKNYDGYKVKGLDEQMIINALDNLADSGRASLIMGGHMSYDDKGRLKADRVFFNYLYNHYNVADVINIDGDLYRKQGTQFPIRLILIDGRKAEPNGAAPLKMAGDDVVTSFQQLYDRVQKVKNIDHGSVLQSDLDVRPGQGDPLYGADAQTATDKAASDTSAPATATGANTEVSTATGNTGALATDTGSAAGGRVAGGQRTGANGSNTQLHPNENGDQSVPLRTNEPGGAAQAGNRAATSAAGAGGVPGTNVEQIPTNFDANRITAEKVPYRPASRGRAVGSVIPTQMASEIERQLTELQREVGNVDDYVRDQLDYPDNDALYRALSAEQIDAVAMGIKQVLNGQAVIIGDQTGVGKGRIAASMVRWGIINGMEPIFLTEKANLFSDFYRDMTATGSGNFVPFIVNDKSSASDPTITDEQGNVLYRPQAAGVKRAAFNDQVRPSGTHFTMATYSQFSDNKETTKKSFLRVISPGRMVIADESHNMSGDSNTGAFFQNILSGAQGVVYLSATFAKRPDNIPIYAVKTAMSEANMTHDDLVNAITRGGVALQEIVSAELAESGQMVRRERDFTGVNIDYEVLDHKAEEYKGRVDNVTSIMRDIIAFQDEHIQPLISEMDNVLAGEGGRAGERQGTSMAGADNVPFASKVFQVVHQLLFALKANDVADAALQELNANRKPVIGFNSTMESFFDYMGLQPGDELSKADFSLSLLRGLEGTLRYTEKDAQGNSLPKSFSLMDLTPEGQQMYQGIRTKIQQASTGVPISPIDAIIKRIEDAGYTVKEITGRSMQLRYNDAGGGKIEARIERDKNRIAREFNNGDLDVIMINASGSTGLSLHASETFRDQRQRTMISGQLELDVNTEVQKRGRIDRTGQVARGRYRYVVSPIPAEKRLLMMFRSKLKSLDANTTSSQKQKTSDVAVVDFLNKHGDQVILEYLANNQKMNLALRDPLKLLSKSDEDIAELKAKGNEARMVTGRVALLPSDMQEKFYNDVTDMYVKHMEMLDSIGANDLEVKGLPLAAKTLSRDVIIEGKGGRSPFGRDSILEKVEANVMRKPLSQADLQKEIDNALGGRSSQDISEEMGDAAEQYLDGYIQSGIDDIRARHQEMRDTAMDWVTKKAAKMKDAPPLEEMYQQRLDEITIAENASIERFERKESNQKNLILSRLNYFKIGRPYGVPTNLNADVSSAYVPGVFLGFDIGNATENRYRPSNITMRFATPMGSLRMIKVPMSRTNYINAIVANTNFTPPSEWANIVDTWDNRARVGDRQTRYIVSGNILQGFNYAPGQLVSYTTDAGQLRKGVLLSEDFKPEVDAVTRVPIGKAEQHLKEIGLISSSNNEVQIEKAGVGYLITVPASKSVGGKYYLNKDLRKLVSGKDFRQTGTKFTAQFSDSKLKDVLNILQGEFNLAVNIPKTNLRTQVLPKELQVQHDSVAYSDKPKQLAQAGAATEDATKGIVDVTDIKPRTFAQDFSEQAVTSHVGYEITSHKDVADLFAMYRSPFVEKTHLVFVKEGKIVANHSITSNSPVETPMWNPAEVAFLAKSYDADGVFLVHNHPSGDPTPSIYDELITASLAQRLPQQDIEFKGHVVLNGDRYAFIDRRGRSSMQNYTAPQPGLFSPRYQFSEDYDEFTRQAVDVAHYILKDVQADQIGIVYVDPANRVSGYDLITPNSSPEEIVDTIRNGLVPNGAANYYIVSDIPRTNLSEVEMPAGLMGEVSLTGGIRSVSDFKVEPESDNVNHEMLQARRKTAAAPPSGAGPAPSTSNVPPPFTVEIQKTSRIKEFTKQTKQNMTELFAVGGGIDKALRDIKETELGNFNELKTKARHIQQDFRHVIREQYGKKNLTAQENEVIDKALKGDKKALASLAQPVQDVVGKMRDYIDSLTQRMIEAGVIPDAADIRAQIQEHLDQSADAGVEPNERYMSLLNTKLKFAEKIENNIGTYVNRAYLKYRVKNWRDRVGQEKIDAAVHYLYNEALLQGIQMDQNRATEIVEDILKSNSMEYVMNSSKFAVNFNILKKMKDIPSPIRDLMGEVKEAEWNFINTVTKMAQLLERHKFLHSFHDAAVDKFFSHGRNPDQGWTTQLNQPSWGPLHGIWTTPELAEALKEWDGEKVDQSMLLKTWRDINGLAKSAKTTLSWVSELRNMLGNVTLTMFNGNFNPLLFKKGLLAISDALNKVKGEDQRAYVEKLNRLRIVGTSLPYHEIRNVVNELTATLPELATDDPSYFGKMWAAMKHFKNKTGEIYGATDDIYKIMTWEMEKARLKEAYEKSGVQKSDDDIEKEAAEISLRIMPTFSKVPKIVKSLSYNTPFIGTFISYPAELMRTTYNSVGLSIEQMKSDNPEIRKIGAKRFAWHLATAALPYMMAGLAGLLIKSLGYGTDEDERDAILKLLPDYYKNDNVVVWKKNGKYYVWMGSGWDGQSYIRETINAAVRGDDAGLVNAVKTWSAPFAQPTLPLQKTIQYIKNEDQYGRKIMLDADGQDEKAVKTFKHFGDLAVPQTANDVLKPVQQFSKGNEEKGYLGVLKLISGQTVLEIDPEQALGFKARDLEEEKKEIIYKARTDNRNGKSVEEVNNWMNGRLQELQKKYDDLVKLQKILK